MGQKEAPGARKRRNPGFETAEQGPTGGGETVPGMLVPMGHGAL